jgi:ATP-binding cassette, subfamily C, type I secretion system permease/ATPase
MGPLRQAFVENRSLLLHVAVFSALLNLLFLAPTLYMMQVYDRVIPTGSHITLALLTLATVGALATLSLLDWFRSRLLVHVSSRLDARLAGPVLQAVLRRPSLSRVERSAAMRDFDAFRQSFAGPALLAAFDAPWTPIYLLVGFVVHPLLGLTGLVSAAVLVALAWLNERATHKPLERANQVAAAAYTEEEYASRSADTVRALGMRTALTVRQLNQRREVIALQNDASFASGRYLHLIKAIRLTLQSLAMGLGAWLAIERQISPGAVFAASFLIARMLAPIEQVVAAWKSIVLNTSAYGRLKTLLADAEIATPTRLPEPKGEISVEGVAVASAGHERAILQDVTFTISPGEMVGLVGPSGAGKTTLARVLSGALAPIRGTVRIDGAAYSDWDPERLGRHIGYLPQDFVLFAGTVKENISRFRGALDEPGADIDAMTVKAAQLCGVHDMILRLPQGYDTRLGIGGVGLSAGQTQRIALARAVFGDPRLLVLDEPNAHLDADGEIVLDGALIKLRDEGCAVVVVAHRSNLLRAANRILLLRDGRLDAYSGLEDLARAMREAADARAASAEAVIQERMRA